MLHTFKSIQLNNKRLKRYLNCIFHQPYPWIKNQRSKAWATKTTIVGFDFVSTWTLHTNAGVFSGKPPKAPQVQNVQKKEWHMQTLLSKNEKAHRFVQSMKLTVALLHGVLPPAR